MRWIRLLGLCLCLAAATPAAAASPAAPVDPQAAIAQAGVDIHAAAAEINTKALTDAEIEGRLATLRPVQARLAAALQVLGPRQQNLLARQAQLGPSPTPPVTEDARTAEVRRTLGRTLAAVTADVKQARLLSLTADQLSATLSDRLRENFAARLWSRSRSLADPGLWRDFAKVVPTDIARLRRAVTDEAVQAESALSAPGDAAIAVAAALISLAVAGPLRVVLDRLGRRRAARGAGEPRLRRVALALWLVAAGTGSPLLAGLLLREVLMRIGALTPDFDRALGLLVEAGVFGAYLESLGRALLSPGRPEWRLVPAPPGMVSRLAPFPGVVAVATAFAMLVAGFNTILGASLATRVATDCVAILVELTAVGGVLLAIGRARVAQRAMAPDGPSAADADPRLSWLLATLAAWCAVAVALVAVLVGYQALAGFLMRETVWIFGCLGLLFLLLRFVDDVFSSLLAPETALGGALEVAVGVSRASLDQVAVLLSGLARVLLLLIALVVVLAPVGPSVSGVLQRFTTTNFVMRVGLVSISPGAVLGGLALFAAGLAITRGVRRWLERRYLPKTDLDLGLRSSLATGVTYLGVLVSVVVAFAYLGLSVAQIALFASALSVGIGFGLQAIIGNVFSGLILLAERPVRVGDWVALGDLEGDVRKINVRATEIEMMDHSRLIVPNSELISKTVRNVTHAGAMGRVKIVLRVAAEADPVTVRDILLARMRAHPQVLKEPAPVVYMTDARDAGIEFSAFAFLTSPRLAVGVKSDLLFQIVPDLRAAGIAQSAAAPVVHVELGAPRPEGSAS